MIFDRQGLVEFVQVSYELNTGNLKRELGELWETMRFFDEKTPILVTAAQEDEFEEDGLEINVLPFHKLGS